MSDYHDFKDSGLRCAVFHLGRDQCQKCETCGQWVSPGMEQGHGQPKLD